MVTDHLKFEIPNYKHQITNKSQYPMTKTELVPIGRVRSLGFGIKIPKTCLEF